MELKLEAPQTFQHPGDLLIVPYGIETTSNVRMYFSGSHPFNRTLWN